jgi:hypothetical protein
MTTKIPAELSSTPGISDSSDATAITIDSSEKVGLNGLSAGDYWSSSNQLVFGNTASAANGGMTIATASDAVGQIYFADGTSGNAQYRGQIQYTHVSDAMDFATAATFAMRIDSAGNALFGTTSSSIGTGVGIKLRADSSTAPYMGIVLDTNSSAHGNYMHYNLNSTYNGYRFYVFNNGGIANYQANNSNLSDERVKTNIELSGNYLEKICNIPVKLFNYKDEPENKERSLGVIAQDVEAVAPELVNNEGFGDTPEDGVPLKTVYTTDMMYALMKAIQEQQDIIDDLKSRIETLEG